MIPPWLANPPPLVRALIVAWARSAPDDDRELAAELAEGLASVVDGVRPRLARILREAATAWRSTLSGGAS